MRYVYALSSRCPRWLPLALLGTALAPSLHAQCQGSLGTLTLPDPSFGTISEVDLDIDGDGIDDLRLRRTDPSGFGDAQLIEAVALGTTQIANLTQPNRPINVTANNGAVTLFEEDLMFGIMNDFVTTDPYLEVEVGGRDGYVEFRNLNAQTFTDATIDVVERGVAAVGANNPTTAQCASLQAPVPVTLRSFEAAAQGGVVHLSWMTATERDCAGFAVERSVDAGAAFEEIGYVAGAGDSRRDRSYAFTDRAHAPSGELYYRLRQVDYDGAVSYSPVRMVALGYRQGVRIAGANAVSVGTPLRLAADVAGRAHVVDALGRRVLTVSLAPQLELPTAALAPGRYYLTTARPRGTAVAFHVLP